MLSFDETRAHAEGWGIFESSEGGAEPLQLQRLDEAGIFADDAAAMRHVLALSVEGSAYHRDALALLQENAPAEWAKIAAIAVRDAAPALLSALRAVVGQILQAETGAGVFERDACIATARAAILEAQGGLHA